MAILLEEITGRMITRSWKKTLPGLGWFPAIAGQSPAESGSS